MTDEQAIAFLTELQEASKNPEPEYEPVWIGELVDQVLQDIMERNGAK